MIGAHPRRLTLWSMAAGGALIGLGTLSLLLRQPLVLAPIGLWLVFCFYMSQPVALRTPEYWWKARRRYKKLPPDMDTAHVGAHHALLTGEPRGVVEILQTHNLRMTDDETLGSFTKRLHLFYLWLRFPVQIVVRAWPAADGHVNRRWFIALQAPTDKVLNDRQQSVVKGLKRAGLLGEALNGNLYDTQQVCWTRAERNGHIGPQTIHREQRYSIVDGEYVRAVLLTNTPRTVDANWLAPILDGDLPADVSLWLDPLDNQQEMDALMRQMSDLETAQLLNQGTRGGNGRLGYRDPDLDDQIRDVQRTRLLLRRHLIRVLDVSISFVVRGDTEDEMMDRERNLIDQLQEHVGMQPALPCDWEQDWAARLVVPLGERPPVSFPLRVISPALARTYPFSNSCISMPNGVRCGTSLGSLRENTLNLFHLASPHMVIPALTGAGKGFWLKCFLLRWLRMPEWASILNVVIIQSEKDEYTPLAELIDGHVVRGDIEDYDPKWNLTVFDLTKMPQSDKGAAIAKILGMVEQAFSEFTPPRYGVVVVDELGIVLRDKVAANAIETAYRRFRSIPWIVNPREVNRIAMIGLTQRPADLLNHENGKVLAAMALTKLFLRSDATELRAARSVLRLSSDELDFLETGDEGDGLLVAGNARVGLHLNATPEENEVART